MSPVGSDEALPSHGDHNHEITDDIDRSFVAV